MTEVTPPPIKIDRAPKVENSVYKPGVKGLFERFKNFVGIADKVESATGEVSKDQVDKVTGSSFFDRVGSAIERGVNKVKETGKKAWEVVKNKWTESKEYFSEKAQEIQERRQNLGIIDTAKSYVLDGVDFVKSKIDLVEAKWKDAEVKQLVGERARLNDSYAEAKRLKANGEEVPEGYIVNRSQLRESLKPIRVAELAARAERRALRAEAKLLRGRIERKQNAKDLFAKAKSKGKATSVTPEATAAAI
ncbi:MAG: hypothetical protein WC503_05780 [Candidatus Shapirobacteria bacterium]